MEKVYKIRKFEVPLATEPLTACEVGLIAAMCHLVHDSDDKENTEYRINSYIAHDQKALEFIGYERCCGFRDYVLDLYDTIKQLAW